MRHGFKKAKFGQGHDSNRALLRKLSINFFLNGKIKTTLSKVRALKPVVENMVGKIKRGGQADKNNLLKALGDPRELDVRFKDIATALSKVSSGYTKIVKLGRRDSDGAEVGELTWAYPVVTKKS